MKPTYAYEKMRYGFFVHYIASQAPYLDGHLPADINEAADQFDVPRFIDEIASMKVEYLIFTAWHYLTIPLYPSEVTRKWRPGRYIRRDLVGEIIDGARERGIRVILYTHPRDGHDFTGQERIDCGWGEGWYQDMKDTPNPDTFDYEKWNRYTLELYEELAMRYGNRIDGIWTDGMGPGRFIFGIHRSYSYEHPIVDYTAIRRILKKVNPDIALIQNAFGHYFSNDFIMSESFFDFEFSHKDTGDWPVCHRAMAFVFSDAGWEASGRYGQTETKIDCAGMARYIILQATAASAGGTCLAAGPYCGGGWDVGILEYMQKIGSWIEPLGESLRDIVPSTSWPTIPGDNMKAKNYIAACSSGNRSYEYIHILQVPKDGVVRLPASADGAKISCPVPLTKGVTVSGFQQNEEGVCFKVEGTFGEIDTVVRFKRHNNLNAEHWIWINDSDKRIRYKVPEDWTYHALSTRPGGREETEYIGCYEADIRRSEVPGARFDTWFEGSEIELIAAMDPVGGEVDVLIDDICVASVSTYAETRQTRTAVFRSGELYGGIHTFSVVLKKGRLEFDALRIRK